MANAVAKLKIGDVVKIPAGMPVFGIVEESVVTLPVDAQVVIESVRGCPVGSEDDHFEECWMCDGRVLSDDGSYNPNGQQLTFAQYGDFREELILKDATVLKHMQQTFV